LTGEEVYEIEGLAAGLANAFSESREVTVRARLPKGSARQFRAVVRIDTPQEVVYYRHGGILQYVLRQLLAQK
jgi:aconitate hydratase